MKQVLFRARRALRLGGPLLALAAVPLSACGDGDSLVSSESPLPPPDSTPPIDSVIQPPDTTPPPDTTTPPPPPDSTPPPGTSICGAVVGAPGSPEHVGLAFGPHHIPRPRFGEPFSVTQITATLVEGESCLLIDLESARRANLRVFISFTGNEQYLRDANGFSMTKWKQRVDRFRNVDLQSYIDDGTILAHLIMDEPSDPSNWSGKPVTHAEIEEIARYSKEVWPTMPVLIRVWPDYLKGADVTNLDAIWIHYLHRRGPIDEFISTHLAEIRALGLNVVGGLNVLNGGSPESNIPGKKDGLKGMTPDELRAWGGKWLAQPGMCAFLLWEYSDAYFSRPEIKEAIADLAAQARAYPMRSCKKE